MIGLSENRAFRYNFYFNVFRTFWWISLCYIALGDGEKKYQLHLEHRRGGVKTSMINLLVFEVRIEK